MVKQEKGRMKNGRELLGRNLEFNWKTIFFTNRHSEGTKLPQLQPKERECPSQSERLPSIEKKGGIRLAAEERHHAFDYTAGEYSLGVVATVPKGSLQPMTPECHSIEAALNKPKLGIQVKEQTQARPLQELLHLKEEPIRLWELLSMKDETFLLSTGKNSEVSNEPLNLLHKKDQKFVRPREAVENLHILDSMSTVFSGFHTKTSQSAEQMSTSCNLLGVSLSKNINIPGSNSRTSGSKKHLTFLESLYQALHPRKLAYCYYGMPIPQPLTEKSICITDIDHDSLVTREKATSANPAIHGSQTPKLQMHSQSLEQNCHGRAEAAMSFEPISSFKRGGDNVIGDEAGKISLPSGVEDLDHPVLQLDRRVKESLQELGIQDADTEIDRSCECILLPTETPKERTSSASVTKGFLLGSYNLKEGITPSRFLCFSQEGVEDPMSGKRTGKKVQNVASLSERSEGNHASILREDHLSRKKKVYPSDYTKEGFICNKPEKLVRINREHSCLANLSSKCDVACRNSGVNQLDHPLDITCSLSGGNGVATLRDMLFTNTEVKDFPVIGPEHAFKTYEKLDYLDMTNAEFIQTQSPQILTSEQTFQPQVNMLDHVDLGHAWCPDVQKKVLPEIRSCSVVEGADSIYGGKSLGGNGQPSPVSVLDACSIEKFVSPVNDRVFSDSEDQLIHECYNCSQLFLETAAIDMLDSTSNGTYYEYAGFEKVVEALVHIFMIKNYGNIWFKERILHSVDAQVSASSSNNTFSLESPSNSPMPEDERGQGDEPWTLRSTNNCKYPLLQRQRVSEELLKNQMLVDCVTEALETLNRRETCSQAATLGLHDCSFSRKISTHDIYQVIFSWSKQTTETMDDLVEKDLNFQNWRWISIKSEVPGVGTEIECLLLEILIEDVIFDMLNLEAES